MEPDLGSWQSPDILRSYLYRGTIAWTPTTAIYRAYTVHAQTEKSLAQSGTYPQKFMCPGARSTCPGHALMSSPASADCGWVKPYSSIDLGQNWRHQAITWTNLDLSSQMFCGIHLRLFTHAQELNYTPRTTKLLGGYTGFTPSVRPSVRPSRMPCPLCIIYSYGWILFILGTNDHYHERVCRAPWPLTLTYIFKVIWPWLRKSCPLCSVYSSGWILSIFGTNDHYH